MYVCADEKSQSPMTSPAVKNKGPTESSGFMNALSSTVQAQKSKKVKKIPRVQPNVKVARSASVTEKTMTE